MISIPFSGSKRGSYKYIKEITYKGGYNSVYEPFGGSGVLSVNLLNDGIVNYAVVNDYDRFFDLYPEYLDLKDKIVNKCLDYGMVKSDKPLPKFQAIFLQNLISKYVPEDSDMWRLICSGHNFTHSIAGVLRKAVLSDFKYLRCDINTKKQREYLKALNRCKIEHLDCFEFVNKYKAEINNKSLLILDPPYIQTYQCQYSGKFNEENTIDLLEEVTELNCDFIFFNQNQSNVLEWLNEFDCEIQIINNSSIRSSKNRKDVMAYVKR